jgi:hypothetical protein
MGVNAPVGVVMMVVVVGVVAVVVVVILGRHGWNTSLGSERWRFSG